MTSATEHIENATLGNEKTFTQREVVHLMESYARLHHIEQLERARLLADHAYLNEIIHCKKCDDWDGPCEAHRR